MLILTRHREEAIVINVDGVLVTVRVLGIECNRVLLGIVAPDEVRVLREELIERERPQQASA